MKLRKCSKCKIEFELNSKNFHRNKTEVDGFDYRCKECKLTHYINNKEKYKERSISWIKENPEKTKEASEKYRKSKKGIKNRKQYRKKEYKEKYQIDMDWTILRNLRVRLNKFLKGEIKTTLECLGCPIKEYRIYLESKFKPEMNWGNYGTYWEVDHIIPLSKGGSFHYSNTQPLTINENRSKGNKI